ncbi:phytoene desaturase family protein [Alkalibacterium sp.]
MRMNNSSKQKKSKIVVIGGGLGGVSSAISLAQKGYTVSLYEKNSHIGGKLNRLETDGFGFDLGPSILTMPHIFNRLFEQSGKQLGDYVPIEKLTHEWRSFFTDGTVLDLYNDLDEMKMKNPQLSEKDMQEYRNYLDYTKKLYEATEEGYFDKGLDDLPSIFRHHGVLSSLRNFDYFHTMAQGIEKRVSNPYMQDMLKYYIKYVGSSAESAPAILNVLAYVQKAQGLWYVQGGMHKLAEGLVKLAEEEGVTFHTNTEVTEITYDSRKTVTGIKLSTGEFVKADRIVSNMEVVPTYNHLLNMKSEFTKKLEEKFEPAASGLVLHLGVNRQYPQLAHHNFFFSEDSTANYNTVFKEKQLPDDPTIYLVNSNKSDESQAPSGYENIKVLPHIPYIQDEPFTDGQYAELRERVLIKLEKMGLTDLRKHIVVEDKWTPVDIEQTYYSTRGAIYGVVSDRKKNKGFKFPKISAEFSRLYFVGGSVNPGGGMPMVTLSGQQVSEIISKEDDI